MLLAAYRYGGYGFYFDPTYFLVVIGLLLSLWASSVVNSTFNKYSKVRCMSNLSGAEAARKVLDSCGLYNVSIEHISGKLTDHYDPRSKVLRLSDSTYASRSVAAVCVAAHEAAMRSRTRSSMVRWCSGVRWCRWQTLGPRLPGRYLFWALSCPFARW